MSNLRKVVFTLEEQYELSCGEFMEATTEEQEKAKKREGFFHAWGNECFFSDEELVSRIVGIVEEESSGKVYHVVPKRITFVK